MSGTIWDSVLARIETKVNRYSYYTWFKPTSFGADDGTTITVRVGDPMAVDWLLKHYTGVIREALAEVGRPEARLTFQPEGHEESLPPAPRIPEPPITAEPKVGVPEPELPEVSDVVGLSPRYSFDTFIVGASNQFAHAACRAVAEAPSRSYHPLVLYGGVGLGKTHLRHAIGQYVLTHSPGLKLTYISAERFMNEVINAIRYDRILEFRER